MLLTFEKIKENKLERYTDNLFQDVIAMVGYTDDIISPFILAYRTDLFNDVSK
jgi:uncharacterized membrane protein YkvA (DUF1232 family)